MVINTTVGARSIEDSRSIRRQTLNHGIPYYTTVRGATATVDAMLESRRREPDVKPLQAYY